MYEVDPESREVMKYRATPTYIINRMKKSGEIEFQALDVLQPTPEYPDPQTKAYMETVQARVELHFIEMKRNEDDISQQLFEAHQKILALEYALKEAQAKIGKLEEQLQCPTKIRKFV